MTAAAASRLAKENQRLLREMDRLRAELEQVRANNKEVRGPFGFMSSAELITCAS